MLCVPSDLSNFTTSDMFTATHCDGLFVLLLVEAYAHVESVKLYVNVRLEAFKNS